MRIIEHLSVNLRYSIFFSSVFVPSDFFISPILFILPIFYIQFDNTHMLLLLHDFSPLIIDIHFPIQIVLTTAYLHQNNLGHLYRSSMDLLLKPHNNYPFLILQPLHFLFEYLYKIKMLFLYILILSLTLNICI